MFKIYLKKILIFILNISSEFISKTASEENINVNISLFFGHEGAIKQKLFNSVGLSNLDNQTYEGSKEKIETKIDPYSIFLLKKMKVEPKILSKELNTDKKILVIKNRNIWNLKTDSEPQVVLFLTHFFNSV